MHRPPRWPLTVAITLLALLALTPLALAAGTPEGTIVYEHETEAEFLQQLASGKIRAATINKRTRSLRLTLKDGRHVLAKYPKKQGPREEAALKAKHVPVSVLSAKEAALETKGRPVHHKLRYIAGGVLLVVLLIVGTVLYVKRRRSGGDEVPAGVHSG